MIDNHNMMCLNGNFNTTAGVIAVSWIAAPADGGNVFAPTSLSGVTPNHTPI
jgi:hypothetical protein